MTISYGLCWNIDSRKIIWPPRAHFGSENESLKGLSGPYSFATAVFTSVLVAPDVSGHDHFGALCTCSLHGKSVQVPIRL